MTSSAVRGLWLAIIFYSLNIFRLNKGQLLDFITLLYHITYMPKSKIFEIDPQFLKQVNWGHHFFRWPMKQHRSLKDIIQGKTNHRIKISDPALLFQVTWKKNRDPRSIYYWTNTRNCHYFRSHKHLYHLSYW